MSTSSFLTTVAAVLSNQSEISELPSNKLNALTFEGDVLEENIPPSLLAKIARLQTLIMQSRDKAEMPDHETICQIAQETQVDFITASANQLATTEDMTHQVMMLERLIVEVVREAFPKECSRFDIQYWARPDGKIVRVPMQQRRFLD